MENKTLRLSNRSFFFRGSAIASLLVAFVYSGFYGAALHIGIAVLTGMAIGLAACAVGVGILGLLLGLFIFLGRKLPRLFNGDFASSIGDLFKALPIPSASAAAASALFILLVHVFFLEYPFPFAFITGPFIVFIESLLGGSIAIILAGEFKKLHLLKKILLVAQVVFLIFINYSIVEWLVSSGESDHLIRYKTYVPRNPEKLHAANPGEQGSFGFKTLTYGSGTDKKRPEYGKNVAVKTRTVDASVILKGYKGLRSKIRNWYWGFDIKKFPLNGRVWYPEGAGPFPLVLVVHGNHDMDEYSDPGYAYLGELLASQGFILVSVDENFLNGGAFGDMPGKKSENAARGWMLLQHLEMWKEFNEDETTIFYKKVDMNNIALIGHSRGGEAAAHAASLNRLPRFADDGNLVLGYCFNIKAIAAIAPVDGQYRPSDKPLPLENIDYFSIQGSHDADMSVFHGSRQYQRVKFTDNTGGGYRFKATLYIYRANHGQFNTVWGRRDFSPPAAWFLNTKPLLSMEDQLKIAKIYISAFLQVSLQGKNEYLPIFRNHRAILDLLPKTLFVNRFEDSTFKKITDYEEDLNPASTSWQGGELKGNNLVEWSEEDMKFRSGQTQENHVARLGWRKNKKNTIPSYSIRIPESFLSSAAVDGNSFLVFSIADTGDVPFKSTKTPIKNNIKKKEKKPLDMTIELEDGNGARARLPLSYFSTLHPPLKSKLSKWAMMEAVIYKKDVDPLLETFEFPLKAFKEANPVFQPGKLVKIVFVFDRSTEGAIYLDDVGVRF